MIKATKIAKNLEVDYIHFRPYHYEICSISDQLNRCRSHEIDSNFSVLASSQKYNLVGSFKRNYSACHGSNFFTVIDSRGDLFICCHHIREPAAKIGSLSDQNYREIINGERRNKVYKNFPKNNCIPFCRLHTQNLVLDRIKRSGCQITKTNLPSNVRQHIMFL